MEQIKKPNGKLWWTLLVVFGFAAVISAFQIDSYAADKFHLNWMWWTFGGISGVIAGYSLYKVYKLWG